MNNDHCREYNIYLIEEYYYNRMEILVNEERFDDSNAIFEEFIIEDENGYSSPIEWLFLNNLQDVY
jgi:hypothetical protein